MALENSPKGVGVNFFFCVITIPISFRRKRIGQNVGFEEVGRLKLVKCFVQFYRVLMLVMHALNYRAGVHS